MSLADNRYPAHAVGAPPAVRAEGKYNTVTDLDLLNSAAYGLDDSCPFMTENGWKRRLPLPFDIMQVAVAYTRGPDTHLNLTDLRTLDVDFLDHKG
jgi:hypothetical protein